MCEGKVSKECLKNVLKNRQEQINYLQSFIFFWRELHLDMKNSFNFVDETKLSYNTSRLRITKVGSLRNQDATPRTTSIKK